MSEVLGEASQEDKPVVIRVIKHLLSPKEEKSKSKFRADSTELAKSLGRLAEEQGFSEELPKPVKKEPAQKAPEATPEDPSFSPRDDERPPLAGASGRHYALQYTDAGDEDTEDTEEDVEEAEEVDKPEDVINLSRHPVPADEGDRLQWLDTHPNIISHVMDLPDLELLCNIARGELQCDATLVTIFGPTACYVVASTDPAWRGAEIPRDHAICGHTLMSDEPLLVRHPEADVRFTAMNLVRRDGVRFYFGFPVMITYPDGGGATAVGTFCCVNGGKTCDVSESQYALMATLAEGVNRVMDGRTSRLLEN
ncbi:hypothetical protein PHMEG_00025680 [Phytophthora megakarya]|uniref:GAF domain-containing protein n=1 Tax=Phytophthora megakarya TaxID=4795 RepID=A0A225VAJ4_9STRA|nr:hypothetical protein PHMEG_00025680 [Phytophthora megakarya]